MSTTLVYKVALTAWLMLLAVGSVWAYVLLRVFA